MDMDNSMDGWVSVSQYAKENGVSVQTIYNKIEQGLLEYRQYQRGTMRGYMIKRDVKVDV